MFSMSSLLSSGSKAALLVGSEPEALAIDFTDDYFLKSTGHYGSAKIKDRTNRSNNYNSNPYDLLTYTAPSLKMTTGPTGTLRFQAHNLVPGSSALEDTSTYMWQYIRAAPTVITPPSFTESAVRISEDTTPANQHSVIPGTHIFVLVGATYTFSVKLKAGTRSWASVRLDGGSGNFGGGQNYFDLANGVLGTISAGIEASKVSVCPLGT